MLGSFDGLINVIDLTLNRLQLYQILVSQETKAFDLNDVAGLVGRTTAILQLKEADLDLASPDLQTKPLNLELDDGDVLAGVTHGDPISLRCASG